MVQEAIPSEAWGRYNRVIEYHDPGVRGFLSRQEGGPSDPVYVTTANGFDGPYTAKNQPGLLYGNIDWRGTVGGVARIVSWGGPAFRYTNWFAAPSPTVGDTSNRPIYGRGKLIATAPLPVLAVALKLIGNTTWFRVVCWQPTTEEWVCFEKPEDAEFTNPDNWDEVGRFPFTDVSDLAPEPSPGDQRVAYESEAVAFFNSIGTKAIGVFTGYRSQLTGGAPSVALTSWPIDFDWPSGSGGPVVFSNAPANNKIETRTVTSSVPGNIVYVDAFSGGGPLARDWDENDLEVQALFTASGKTDVDIQGAASQTWNVEDRRIHTIDFNGTAVKEAIVDALYNKTLTAGAPSTRTASGNENTFAATIVGYDLRTGFVSAHKETTTTVYSTGSPDTIVDISTDRDYDHDSYFQSSLGTIAHVNDSKPTSASTIAWSSFLAGYASVGLANRVREIGWRPRDTIAFRQAPFGNLGGVLFSSGRVQYQFDRFTNEFAYLDHPTEIYRFIANREPNPAFPPENLLSGDDWQTVHGVAFNSDQIGIA